MNRYSMQIIGEAHCPEIDHWVDDNGEWVKFAELQAWQPIETAPRDGTKILVFTAIGDVEIGQWCTTEWDRYELHDADRNLYTRRVDIHEFWNNNFPTHWMPLPEPPQ